MAAARFSPVSPHEPGPAPTAPPALPLPDTIASTTPSVDVVRRKLRILILSSDTGGGHRASAQALRAAFYALYPSHVHVDIVDFWVDLARGPFANFPDQYTFLAKRPWMWKLSFELTRFPPARGCTETLFNTFAHRNVRDAFAKYAPDLILSVHPLVNTLSQKVLRQMSFASGLPSIPYVTVVTDLGGAHPTWFHKAVDMTYVPSGGVCKVARRVGLPQERVRQFGLPVREDFWTASREKDVLRAELGMRRDVPAVLAIGGGDGVGGLKATTKALATELPKKLGHTNVQLVVICGKNQQLKEWVQSQSWPIAVIPLGYVTNMSEWMGACDIICTKAGPGTIAEALIRAMPIIITGYLPGQEEANVKYVVDEKVGAFAQKPSEITATAADWLGDPERLTAMSERALALGKPMASLEIATDVIDVARSKITENMETLERQRQMRREHSEDGARNLSHASEESHLAFRVKFLLRVVIGSMIAKKALSYDSDESCTPPSSPRSLSHDRN